MHQIALHCIAFENIHLQNSNERLAGIDLARQLHSPAHSYRSNNDEFRLYCNSNMKELSPTKSYYIHYGILRNNES
jgi:hypothetical protein